jgi:hypothetical protein
MASPHTLFRLPQTLDTWTRFEELEEVETADSPDSRAKGNTRPDQSPSCLDGPLPLHCLHELAVAPTKKPPTGKARLPLQNRSGKLHTVGSSTPPLPAQFQLHETYFPPGDP